MNLYTETELQARFGADDPVVFEWQKTLTKLYEEVQPDLDDRTVSDMRDSGYLTQLDDVVYDVEQAIDYLRGSIGDLIDTVKESQEVDLESLVEDYLRGIVTKAELGRAVGWHD